MASWLLSFKSLLWKQEWYSRLAYLWSGIDMPIAIKLYFKHYSFRALYKYNYSCIHDKYKNVGAVSNTNLRKLYNVIN